MAQFADHRNRRRRQLVRRRQWNLVLPLTGFALTVWLWTNLSGLTPTVGSCWLAVGFVWLVVLTRGLRRPTPMPKS